VAENLEHSPDIEAVINSVQFIAENMRSCDETKEVKSPLSQLVSTPPAGLEAL
jgi:hypothetical protein